MPVPDAVKLRVKDAIVNLGGTDRPPVIVNSFGRSGSTVLYRSVISSVAGNGDRPWSRLLAKSVARSAWDLDLDPLRSGCVFKTHGYPPKCVPSVPPSIVYVFGDVANAVESVMRTAAVRGEDWFAEHCRHLGAPQGSVEDLLDVDLLRCKDHLSAWLGYRRIPVAFVRYETMWANVDQLSQFLGFRLVLSQQKARESRGFLDAASRARIAATYRDASRIVEDLPDFFVTAANRAR